MLWSLSYVLIVVNNGGGARYGRGNTLLPNNHEGQ